MGLFDGLFGGKLEALEEGSAAAQAIQANPAFTEFAASANDRLEVIPGDSALYVFVGKPPKAFGIVWFEGDERLDVRTLMERGEMARDDAVSLVNALGTIYTAHAQDPRFEHRVDGKKVVVAPSPRFFEAVHQAVRAATGGR